MKVNIALAAAALAVGPATAMKDFTGRVAIEGTVGLGQEQYLPATCAYACRSAMGMWMLECPDDDTSHHHAGMHHMTSPECYVQNDPFLMSLAWCIKTHCEGLSISVLERYWEMNVAGRKDNQPLPKYSYQDALARITVAPTTIYNSSLVLNSTQLVSDFFYEMVYNSLYAIEINIGLTNQYTLVTLVTCIILPVIFSLTRFLPLPASLVSKFYAYVIDPPAFGTRHAVPAFFGLGIVPTRGQALFILYIWGINVILTGVNHIILWPNLWFNTVEDEVTTWVANRTGMLSFANFIIAVLFSSRNNVLLHFTSWTRSTFVLIHRWTAVIGIIQALLHTFIYLRIQDVDATLAEEATYPYWIWGMVATVTLIFMIPGSLLPIRRKAYEFFLTWHYVFAFLSLIGNFLHIFYRYRWQWGYEIWVVVPFAILGFDMFLLRPLKVLRNGFNKKAYVSVIDQDYLKVVIPGAQAKGQAYLYFPTLSWPLWENHPFSVLPGLPLSSAAAATVAPGTPPSEDLEHVDDKAAVTTTQLRPATPQHASAEGIVFFLRRRGGVTAKLAIRAGSATDSDNHGIPVLVEGSYGAGSMSLIHAPSLSPSRQYPNLLVLAGGVGITAVLPLLGRPLGTPVGTTKLYWGVRTLPLVTAVEEMLGGHAVKGDGGVTRWDGAEVTISVGKRFNVQEVLEMELRSCVAGCGTTVVVCGPPGMSDDARLVVVAMAKKGALVRFADERFGW